MFGLYVAQAMRPSQGSSRQDSKCHRFQKLQPARKRATDLLCSLEIQPWARPRATCSDSLLGFLPEEPTLTQYPKVSHVGAASGQIGDNRARLPV